MIFALTSAALAASACAPRVSKRAPAPHPSYAWMVEQPAPTIEPVLPVAQPEPAPAQPVQAAPVSYVARNAAEAPPPAPAPAAEVEEEEASAGDAPAVKPAKTNFYAFSDVEILALRRRNTEFKRTHDRLKSCTAKSEREIQKRENVREEIIRLQNEDYRTPKQEKKLTQLRNEERKMKQARGSDGACQKLEDRLTEMLRAAYPDDTAGARN